MFKGKIGTDDLEDTIDTVEKQSIIDTSINNKINNDDIQEELIDITVRNEVNRREIDKSKKIYENLICKAQDINGKIEKIIIGCDNFYQNTTSEDNDYETIEFNKQAAVAGYSGNIFPGNLSNIGVACNTVEPLGKENNGNILDSTNIVVYDNNLDSGKEEYNNILIPILNKQTSIVLYDSGIVATKQDIGHFYDKVASETESYTSRLLR